MFSLSYPLLHYLILLSSILSLSLFIAPTLVFVSPKRLSVRPSVLIFHRLGIMSRSSAASAGGSAAALGSARPRRVAGAAAARLGARAVFYRTRGQQPTALLATGDARTFFLFSQDGALVSVNTSNYTDTNATLAQSSTMPQIRKRADTVKYPTPNACNEMKTREHIFQYLQEYGFH